MYNHNKAQQSKNRVHFSWDILYSDAWLCKWTGSSCGAGYASIRCNIITGTNSGLQWIRPLEISFGRWNLNSNTTISAHDDFLHRLQIVHQCVSTSIAGLCSCLEILHEIWPRVELSLVTETISQPHGDSFANHVWRILPYRMIRNDSHTKLWDVIIHPCHNFRIEFMIRMAKLFMCVIINPCPDKKDKDP